MDGIMRWCNVQLVLNFFKCRLPMEAFYNVLGRKMLWKKGRKIERVGRTCGVGDKGGWNIAEMWMNWEVQSNEHEVSNCNKFLGRGIVFRKSGKHPCCWTRTSMVSPPPPPIIEDWVFNNVWNGCVGLFHLERAEQVEGICIIGCW
jgi:hypothetical protein